VQARGGALEALEVDVSFTNRPGLVRPLQGEVAMMNHLVKLVSVATVGSVLGGCYAYAGPPRHAYHPRHERELVVVERPRPVVVHERVVVREERHRHHDDDR
jgi:hypothetical protein